METKHSKYILAGLTVLCVLLICITSLKDGIMEPPVSYTHLDVYKRQPF